MKTIIVSVVLAFVLCLSATPAIAQDTRPAAVEFEQFARSDFHTGIVQAVRAQVRAGEMSRKEGLRIRVAMLSPAFAAHAEQLAIIQMTYSGEDGVPLTTSGQVDRTAIDWGQLSAFLKVLLPLITKLLEIFA